MTEQALMKPLIYQERSSCPTKSRQIETIPPTEAALLEHTKRATYQAGHCWSQALLRSPQLPDPKDWGWKKDEIWKPLWSALPEAAKSCQELKLISYLMSKKLYDISILRTIISVNMPVYFQKEKVLCIS